MNLTYPCKRWKLNPGFKPVEIELVEELSYWGDDKWGRTQTGSHIRLTETFDTQADAIADGWKRAAVQQADIDKRQQRLDKRKAALTKAAQP